jgi:hypothetical protein
MVQSLILSEAKNLYNAGQILRSLRSLRMTFHIIAFSLPAVPVYPGGS